LKHFKEYLKEATGHVTFTFGRFNPPTVGHEKLIEKVHSISKGSYRIYASQSHDAKKNPLDYNTKIKFMRKMFPRHARNIINDVKIKTAFDALDSLYAQGYRQVTFVVGSDRVEEFNKTLNKYNGEKRATGFYNFEGGVQVVSAGERDPDAEDVSGMSASKMRAAAGDNNFELFAKGLPSGFKEAQKLFNAVRAGMGLKESYNFRQHIQLPTLSKEREAYVNGDLFKVGDVIEIKESKELGQIQRLGSNYVIIETYNGNKQRKWLKDVIKVEEAVINEMLSKTNWAEYTSINKTKIKSFNDLSTSNGKSK
jgi:phosphopantetheine adenylyltransferase